MSEENKVQIRKFLSRFYRRQTLGDQDDLVALGLLNSLFVAQLVMFLEREFDIRLDLQQLDVEDYRSIDRISRLVAARISNETGAGENIQYVLPNGMKVAYLNQSDTDHFYDDIFVKQSYFANGIHLRDGDCVFDVGANIGLFSLFVLEQNKHVKIFAFEPSPPAFSALSINVAPYADRVHLFDCGISNRDGEASFTHYLQSSGMSTFHPDSEQEREALENIIRNSAQLDHEEADEWVKQSAAQRLEKEIYACRLRTLTGILEEHPVETIDLLKIDVQKSEWEVLEGVPEQYWPRIRQVVLEVHDTDGRVAQVEDFLRQRNFNVLCEQDVLYTGTNHYNVYAVRKSN